MEGIMMRNGGKYAVGVRKPDQEIEVKVEDYRSVFGNLKLMKLPIFRGVASFVDSTRRKKRSAKRRKRSIRALRRKSSGRWRKIRRSRKSGIRCF